MFGLFGMAKYRKMAREPEVIRKTEALRASLAALRAPVEAEEGSKTTTPRPYKLPPLSLLRRAKTEPGAALLGAEVLEGKLKEFGIEGKVENIRSGPVVSRYEIRLAPGERLGSVRRVAEDLAVALSGKVRILAPIPGTSLVGIEVQNEKAVFVGLRSSIKALKGRLPVSLGVDTAGNPRSMDLAATPHLLVAGQTGSGKSVFLNSLIVSLLYSKTPEECRMILIDPKRVEMSSYRGIPHLLRPVVTEPEDAVEALEDLVAEMENRYTRLEAAGARNIEGFDGPGMPYIVCIVDELSDLMDTAGKRLTDLVVRLAQKSRAVGIHLVLATQRPDVNTLNGRIKANIPARIAFQVVSQTDSRVILDEGGAERLAGRGDMLVRTTGEPERFHGAWVSDKEITAVALSFNSNG